MGNMCGADPTKKSATKPKQMVELKEAPKQVPVYVQPAAAAIEKSIEAPASPILVSEEAPVDKEPAATSPLAAEVNQILVSEEAPVP